MKKATIITLFLLLGLFLGTASAGEATLFGPKQYLRTTGSPNVYSDTFSAIQGQGVLIVRNGDADGGHRVTSAEVLVNGEQIFGPSDFKKHVYHMEAAVNLAENNSITVEVRSKPGSYLTIELIEDIDPPTATISADPGTILVGESPTLTWTSTYADTCVIEPDIGTIDPNGSTTVSPTETTTYTITATGPGGTATASVTLNVNRPPLSVSITSPTDATELTQGPITVTGTVNRAEAKVSVNGIEASVV